MSWAAFLELSDCIPPTELDSFPGRFDVLETGLMLCSMSGISDMYEDRFLYVANQILAQGCSKDLSLGWGSASSASSAVHLYPSRNQPQRTPRAQCTAELKRHSKTFAGLPTPFRYLEKAILGSYDRARGSQSHGGRPIVVPMPSKDS